MIKEIWLLNNGSVIQTTREDEGFRDVATGKYYPKHVFLQHIQGMQGHLITVEAHNRIIAGERTRFFWDE